MTNRDSVFLYPREVTDNLFGSDKERGSRFLRELAMKESGFPIMATFA